MSNAPVIALLDYIEEVEQLNKQPAFRIQSDVLALTSDDVAGLPGVSLDLEQEGAAWLVVQRIHETPAPGLPNGLQGCINLSANPSTMPSWLQVEDAPFEPSVDQLAEFHRYLTDTWQPWAEAEILRRKAIGLYKSLFVLHQVLSGEGESPLELVWGIGVANWEHSSGKQVRHPLITQSCFVELDKESFSITVRPRDVEPTLELDCYVELEAPGIHELEKFWTQRAQAGGGVNPFQSHTFEDVLRTAVGYLDPEGVYAHSGDAAQSERLQVTPDWVLFARKRSADVFVADVRRFQTGLAEGQVLPEVVSAFVSEADDVVRDRAVTQFRGLSSSSTAYGVQELYFPLPYNEEQVDIVRKLEHSAGVVVQGPPGTGKTHTIANIVSHYLAQGKRVLVTSKGDTALSVLQGKLPESIRDLSVALLANEREGMKQFERSIQQIASRVAEISPGEVERNIAQLEARLVETHARISLLDVELAKFAEKNEAVYVIDGVELSAQALAMKAALADDTYAWFVDEVLPAAHAPFSDEDVDLLRMARRTVGADIRHVQAVLPSLAQLPSWAQLFAYRGACLREQALTSAISAGQVPALQGPFDAEAVGALLARVVALKSAIRSVPEATRTRVAALAPQSPLFAQLSQWAEQAKRLEAERVLLLTDAVKVPDGAEKTEELLEAVQRLAEGKSAFSFGGLFGGGKEIKQLLAKCEVAGVPAKSGEQWALVMRGVVWRTEAHALLHRWNAVCGEFMLPPADRALSTGFGQMYQHLVTLAQLLESHQRELPQLQETIEVFFGKHVGELTTLEGLGQMEHWLLSYQACFLLSAQKAPVDAFKQHLANCCGELAQCFKNFVDVRLVVDGFIDDDGAQEWHGLVDTLTQLTAHQTAFEVISGAVARLQSQGLHHWAHRIATEGVSGDVDDVLPADWRAAWQAKQACVVFEALDGYRQLRALAKQRAEATSQLARVYQELVAERAWLGVYRNSTDKTKQALQSFLNSIQAMGAGTGVRAVRHRRAAREALEKAYRAVPCWVLPQWRVSETLPAEMGLFDLVIIDEASQSDISSLPAILRGQKLLVVGDHKQVSPAAVGVSEAKIASAYQRLLKGQPHGAHMTADKSIYDLARVVFAGQSVMLKEHFRCVPEIIEYSNREFYHGEIRALRVQREDERLGAPLVDVYVQGGYRKGDKNHPEAMAIVAEIERLVSDPWMSGKSIGVVTLLGHEQARLINELVSARISPEDIIEHDIVVGQPPAFQGRERDIMLVSMVLAPGDRSFSSVLAQQQRLNVAMSRARDRMYLFRSVPDGHFPADSLAGRLLAHFKQPFFNDPEVLSGLRERCESPFEMDVFDELTQRGYRVRPQVRSGGYRIDLVVEGSQGRRLAVECDGDRFHGPDKWAQDMARQRVLERAGWTFWRCFASSFARRRQEVVLDLLATLNELGIEPMAEACASVDAVEHRIVDPMDVAEGLGY